MSFGDVKFGNVAASGHVEGTGADLFIACKFAPQWVIVTNTNAATQLYWTQTMANGSGVKFGAGGAGAITPASAGTPSGTITAPTFTGTALAPHSHGFNTNLKSEAITKFRLIYGTLVGGPFVVGETITAAPSGGTGVVTAVGPSAQLEFASATGIVYGDAITGGTSGATAIATSSGLAVMSTTPSLVGILGASGSYGTSNAGTAAFTVGSTAVVPQGRVREVRVHPSTGEIEFAPDALLGGTFTVGYIDYLQTPTGTQSAGTPAGTVSGSVFVGSPMTTHTHAFTGAGGSIIVISTGGITPGTSGFNIGNDTDINALGANLYWLAGR